MTLDSFYRNGIYEALRQSSPEVENGRPIVLDGQHLLDMAAAVAGYLDTVFEFGGSEVELRNRVTASGPLKGVQNALRLFDDGHVTLARTELANAQAELEAQAAAWEGIGRLLDGPPHVCTCGHIQGVVDGCSGFEDRCRFEAALRTMVGLDG